VKQGKGPLGAQPCDARKTGRKVSTASDDTFLYSWDDDAGAR
jgi:hypothetical protein